MCITMSFTLMIYTSLLNIPTVFKFADDAKCYKSINTQMDSTYLQQNLNSLFQWSINHHLSDLLTLVCCITM